MWELLKPDVTLYEEQLPDGVLERAIDILVRRIYLLLAELA